MHPSPHVVYDNSIILRYSGSLYLSSLLSGVLDCLLSITLQSPASLVTMAAGLVCEREQVPVAPASLLLIGFAVWCSVEHLCVT